MVYWVQAGVAKQHCSSVFSVWYQSIRETYTYTTSWRVDKKSHSESSWTSSALCLKMPHSTPSWPSKRRSTSTASSTRSTRTKYAHVNSSLWNCSIYRPQISLFAISGIFINLFFLSKSSLYFNRFYLFIAYTKFLIIMMNNFFLNKWTLKYNQNINILLTNVK